MVVRLEDVRNLRTAYRARCPGCGTIFETSPSLAMKLGLNQGHVNCPSCEVEIATKIFPDLSGEFMQTRLWTEFLGHKKSPVTGASKSKE